MNTTKTLTHRESFGYWLNEAGLIGDGVEIGSAFGNYSSRILSVWKGRNLFMVDPWENLPDTEYRENHKDVPYDNWYKSCQHLAASDPRAVLIKKRSAEAAPDFKHSSLDFAYIDGNHDYAFVMQDMDLWYPRIKPGGVLCGHDFYDRMDGGAWCGVCSAVLRWMQEHNMVFSVTPCTSWWAIKA